MEQPDLNTEIDQGSDISDFHIYTHAALCEAELQQLAPSTNVDFDSDISDQSLYQYAANYDQPLGVEDTSISLPQKGMHASLCEADLQQLEPSTNVVWDNQISDQILYEYAANYDDPPNVEDTRTSDSQEGKI